MAGKRSEQCTFVVPESLQNFQIDEGPPKLKNQYDLGVKVLDKNPGPHSATEVVLSQYITFSPTDLTGLLMNEWEEEHYVHTLELLI